MKHAFTLILTFILGCQTQTPAPLSFGDLSYRGSVAVLSNDDGNRAPRELGMCELVSPMESNVVFEVLTPPLRHPGSYDCDVVEPFRTQSYYTVKAKRLTMISGPEVPAELTLLSLNASDIGLAPFGFPELAPGDRIMAQIRFSGETWFIRDFLWIFEDGKEVEVPHDNTTPLIVDLPSDFEELVSSAQAIHADYATHCGEKRPNGHWTTLSDEDFYTQMHEFKIGKTCAEETPDEPPPGLEDDI